MKFTGSQNYVATDDLAWPSMRQSSLNARCWSRVSRAPARPCWPSRSPASLGLPLIEWHMKSTTKAVQGLYEYDAVSRLRDSQLGDERVKDVKNYIKKGKLWEAFTMPTSMAGAACC
jgi:hypothetical protein